ncbi:MAG TPA: ECF-type sigma factor [Chthoniobacteraceae bacterium]|jgi:DNA-directed RNA polymerase specialized sigma24 family protein|nr:ECF-type sigma factor [Chthoniobacteraceae bacterium]
MANSQDGDHTLLERYRDGDEAAAKAFFDRYGDRILSLTRLQIARRFTARFDEFDVLQTVMRNFLGNARQGVIPSREGDVWICLRRLARSKVINLIHFHQARKRNLEQSISDPELVEALETSSEHDAVELADLIEKGIQSLGPNESRTLLLMLSGQSDEEISNDLHVTERTVRRYRAIIAEHFSRLEC